jgi:hypothetical protein
VHASRGSGMHPPSNSYRAVRLCGCERSNGPAFIDHLVGIGMGGHKLSAFGSPYKTARLASSTG